jgi:hypothetical protein
MSFTTVDFQVAERERGDRRRRFDRHHELLRYVGTLPPGTGLDERRLAELIELRRELGYMGTIGHDFEALLRADRQRAALAEAESQERAQAPLAALGTLAAKRTELAAAFKAAEKKFYDDDLAVCHEIALVKGYTERAAGARQQLQHTIDGDKRLLDYAHFEYAMAEEAKTPAAARRVNGGDATRGQLSALLTGRTA